MEKRFVWLYQNETYIDNKKKTNSEQKTTVSIEYFSAEEVDNDIRVSIRKAFKEYMNNEFDFTKNDVIDIVTKIRELTRDIEEKKLDVSIQRENYNEWAHYRKGYIDKCGSYKTNWNDIVGVGISHRGIDVTYKKEQFYLNSESKIKTVEEELKPFYEKAITLYNLTKDNEKKKQEESQAYQKTKEKK